MRSTVTTVIVRSLFLYAGMCGVHPNQPKMGSKSLRSAKIPRIKNRSQVKAPDHPGAKSLRRSALYGRLVELQRPRLGDVCTNFIYAKETFELSCAAIGRPMSGVV